MKQDDTSSQDQASTTCSALDWVFVVMATTGEWSDRTEWPVCAVTDETAARAKVEELADRVAAARGLCGESPSDDDDDEWDRYWKRKEAALATVDDIGGGDLDTTFFNYKVPLSSAGQVVVPRSRDDDQ